jgi:hypothetical protein
MKVIATANYAYNGKELQAGDEFDTKTDKHAEILVLAGRAKYAEAEEQAKEVEEASAPKAPRRGTRRSSPAKSGAKVGAMTTRNSGLTRRTYARRDLESEK